jgi:hypothetical protein
MGSRQCFAMPVSEITCPERNLLHASDFYCNFRFFN